MTNPILRSHIDATLRVQAEGGLNMIRGNGKPYFSLTMASWRKYRGRWEEDCFGAAHDDLVKRWPDLAPLAALHLSNIDGVPMHATENGFYALVGAIPEMHAHVLYHAGNSKGHFGGEYREPTPEECLQRFADHARVTVEEARTVRDTVVAAYLAVSHYARVWEGKGIAEAKATLAQWIEAQRPRWAREAQDCISALGLVVFGDRYEPAAA